MDAVAETEEKILSYEEERGKPIPSKNHAIIQSNLIVQLSQNPDYRVMSELSLKLGLSPEPTPDLCLFPKQPLNLLHDEIRVSEVPELIVEIMSPTQNSNFMLERARTYLEKGVKACWVVSPPFHSVTILTIEGEDSQHHGGIVKELVTGTEIDLDQVFA